MGCGRKGKKDPLEVVMASRQGPKSKKLGPVSTRVAKSPSSSTTSSSKQYLETSIDGQSSPASSSARSKPQYFYSENVHSDVERSKENVTVTVRFRPLRSPREIRQGEDIAWYADGETIVRNEHNPTTAYAYDRVFGPTTTTRHVYDIAAQHVVSGAMEGVNGTIFAYGVTSSGKTHTMHGDQRSPGIIPLAVKDAFSIIQETPNREFLLRVSYLEIYNEVVNDLLNPAGQNLRIREDAQVPSYGSWIKIRNLLIDQWSYDTFKLIGELCGGYIETSKKTLARMDMMEASLKVKMNKNGFLPAIIQLLSTSAFSMAVQMDPFFDLDLHIGYIAAVMGPFHRFLQHHFHWRRRWSCFARGRSLKIVLQT
uniref:Kinesin-related protein KIN7C n=1 Tax=Citrullus lanatus TaxID=3654 RepID=A0A8F2EG38_CITLA|nr:kinesin-related protein KIN7C [Citrullus lanatus]